MTDNVEKITEQQLFDRFITLLVEQEAKKEDVKSLRQLGKANELNVKAIAAAAKLYVKATFEEVVQTYGEVEETFKRCTGYDN